MSVANNGGTMSGNAKKVLHLFIDCTKAFDRVEHDMFFEILSKAGVPGKEINIIKKLYLQRIAIVQYENKHPKQLQQNEAFDKVLYCHHVCSTFKRNT